MRRTVCCLLLTIAGTHTALAQSCVPPPPSSGPPVLHLSETATVHVQPSLLVADLVANAESPVAVTAQRRVNDLIAQASGLAGKVTGIKVVFQDYSTSFIDRANGVPAHWIANQTLEMRGTNSEALLALVGQLQGLGLTIGNLGWQVPQDDLDAAGRTARLEALTTLRQEATGAAQALGLTVAGFQSVDLSGGPAPLFGRPRPMMAMAAMAPPIATPDAQNVTETVSADVVLRNGPAAQPSNH